jgi:hypothetical protein
MGSLTPYLQRRFIAHCPRGWECSAEAALVTQDAARRLGFEPRADILLQRTDGARRIWIEFEISRADPVANHAKFATTRFFEGSLPGESFVSMSSRHIAPGRAALAAGTAMMMRALGVPAFQVDLLPQFDGTAITGMNRLPVEALQDETLSVAPEIERVLEVTDARLAHGWHRIAKADNAYTVAVNIRQWNAELIHGSGRAFWAKRTARYFAYDPVSGLFAPSKFCAFIPAPHPASGQRAFTRVAEAPGGMTNALYATLGERDSRFDGHVARVHLESRLGYRLVPLSEASIATRDAFLLWQRTVDGVAGACGNAAQLLLPPRWMFSGRTGSTADPV